MSTEADASKESDPLKPPPKKPATKKRRRSDESSSSAAAAKKASSTTAKSKKTKVAASAAASTTSTRKPPVPPTHTLIIDNGGDTLKYGWITEEQPKYLPNVTARLAHQITLLVGDELARVQNPNSLVTITRSLERGLISNMGNQTQVWKRLLDLLGVAIPLPSEAATALGWKVSGAGRTKQTDLPAKTIPSHSIAVVLLLPPHYPRLLLDQIVYVWLEDFGVAHVGFGNSTVCAAQEHSTYKTSCTVDLGWSSSVIVPTFRNQAILSEAIRRLPIGGRHLINILKYHMSYRQYNLMDQEHLLKQVLEQLSYVSLQFEDDLKMARHKPSGRRPYDRDYILPDYQRTHQGHIRIPPALQRDLERELKEKNNNVEEDDDDDDDDDEEDDEDFEADDSGDDDEDDNLSDDEGNKDEADKKKSKDTKMDTADDDDDEDDEEQTIEQRRKQLLQQRAEEERRRREQEEEEQVLRLSVERFSIPEILFRPSDAGFPSELVGLAPAIIQSIQACPEHFHAALYRSIRLVGGLSKIPHLAPRLDREVRALAPTEYEVHVDVADSSLDQAWFGAKRWITQAPYTEWSISREEWETAGKRKAYSRLLKVNGGTCI
jgi:actin-related protein